MINLKEIPKKELHKIIKDKTAILTKDITDKNDKVLKRAGEEGVIKEVNTLYFPTVKMLIGKRLYEIGINEIEIKEGDV